MSAQFDERTERNIATLHPRAQRAAREFMAAAVPAMQSVDLVVKIIGGMRTYAEQDALYAIGRTKPGSVVTKARGGYSNHNFGTAWDVGIFTPTGRYLEESPAYETLGKIGQNQGLEWGGSWKFSDEPHFEVKTGLTMAEKRERMAAGKDLFS